MKKRIAMLFAIIMFLVLTLFYYPITAAPSRGPFDKVKQNAIGLGKLDGDVHVYSVEGPQKIYFFAYDRVRRVCTIATLIDGSTLISLTFVEELDIYVLEIFQFGQLIQQTKVEEKAAFDATYKLFREMVTLKLISHSFDI